MKITCNMASDLLPLYLDDSCSADSKAALEEHLGECSDCRDKLARMQNNVLLPQIKEERNAPQLVRYAKKVRHHRIRMTAFAVVITVSAAFLLSIGYLTMRDMHSRGNPILHEVEAGTYNLTANPLTTTAEEVGQYLFYTNNNEIAVSIQGEETHQGTVRLWNAADRESYIMSSELGGDESSCTFTSLSASNRYKISCDGLTNATITVTDNRTVNFWESLRSVLWEFATW